MKFDCVIGNPPYTDGTKGAANIYTKFLDKVSSLAKEYIIFVTPSAPVKGAVDKQSKLFRQIIKSKLLYITDTSKYFDVNIDTCGYVLSMNNTLKEYTMNTESGSYKVSSDDLCFFDIILNNIINKMKDKLQCNFWEECHSLKFGWDKLSSTTSSYSEIDKLSHLGISFITSNNKNEKYHDQYRVVNSYLRNSRPWLAATHIIKPNITIPSKYRSIPCSSKLEAESIHSMLSSKLYQFLHEKTLTSRSLDGAQTKFCPRLDTHKIWTDEELYEHFNLTKEEIDYIETTIK